MPGEAIAPVSTSSSRRRALDGTCHAPAGLGSFVHQMATTCPQDIRTGADPDETVVSFDDREMVDALINHEFEGVEEIRVGLDTDHVRTGKGSDWGCGTFGMCSKSMKSGSLPSAKRANAGTASVS